VHDQPRTLGGARNLLANPAVAPDPSLLPLLISQSHYFVPQELVASCPRSAVEI
jgi:hypothetical protein